jgi:hypothetical protein
LEAVSPLTPMNDQTLMIATILWLRKPPRLQAIVTHFTRAVCAKRDLILLVVLGLDLLLLLHSRLTAAVEAVVVAVAAVADCLGADASAPRRERASSMRRRSHARWRSVPIRSLAVRNAPVITCLIASPSSWGRRNDGVCESPNRDPARNRR